MNKRNHVLLVVCFLVFINSQVFTQPADLPWAPDSICNSIVNTGIIAVTCGTTIPVPPSERYTFGLININGALPAAGRIDVSAQQAVYHHPSWLVDSIGNVFGITMDDCGNIYTTASSCYGADFFGIQSVIRYGQIGGGASDIEAAGTIYKIDGLTGQASVFSVLPQQVFSFTHISCEGATTVNRNTGPGLGNIFFYPPTQMFYCTNFEDGRIYRLDINGTILDSYDPNNYDTGSTGTPVLNELTFGITVKSDGSELFFGTSGVPQSTSPSIYSVFLNPDGSFQGVVNNSSLPAGATWDNYTGTETFHFNIVNPAVFQTVFSASDMEFTPTGNLLIGVRMGCNNIHTSYNHGGSCILLAPDAGGIYNSSLGFIYTGYEFSLGGSNECYGGVGVFENPVGGTEFAISSADILQEDGPHGICIIGEGTFGSTGNPVNPCGAISYGTVDNAFQDPKGVGGDIWVYKGCGCVQVCPTNIAASADASAICSGNEVTLNYTQWGGNVATIPVWQDLSGNPVNADSLFLFNNDCAPVTYDFVISTLCEIDATNILKDTVSVTVFGNEVLPYVTYTEEPCEVSLSLDPDCSVYFETVGTIPVINPGDTGIAVIMVMTTDSLQCGSATFNLSYACPTCSISNMNLIPLECQDSFFSTFLTLDILHGSESFTVSDQNGFSLGIYDYADLPILIGPFLGDSVTTYTLTVQDLAIDGCSTSASLLPQDCLVQIPVAVVYEVFVPNVFSPNYDGGNDYITLFADEESVESILYFSIYDRWGNEVFRGENFAPNIPTLGWDGKFRGKLMNPAVFGWYAKVKFIDGTIQLLKGDLTLVR
jgi:gliding motility-associated-like protein